MQSASLSHRAMLATLSISVWSARKLDRSATESVIRDAGAESGAGRFNKVLLDSPELRAVTTAANAARSAHMAVTSPWLDDGARILSAANFLRHRSAMTQAESDFGAAVETFLRTYDRARDDARRKLGDLWRDSDYPAARDVARRFGFTVRRFNLPDASDFRVDLGDAQAELIRAEIQRSLVDASAAATRDAFERVAEAVGAMAERLAAYKPGADGRRAEGVFRDSLVANVRDLAAVLPGLNVAGDPRLAAVAERIAAGLVDFDAQVLRDDSAARRAVQAEAQSILDSISDVLA